MSDDRPPPSDGSPNRSSWWHRLSHAILGEPRDRDDLVDLLRDAHTRDLIDNHSLAMIEGVLQVSEMRVRDIMIPRAQMVVVEREAALSDILPTVIKSAHSRFPVIGDSRDEVVGILLAKDLLSYCQRSDPESFQVREVLRPAVFVPESKRLDALLREFRASRNHLAVVVDEYGGVAGMVTIEDVLEQIVGEIEDEHDFEEETQILARSDGSYTVRAGTPIDDFNERFATAYPDEEYDTVAGLVLKRLGHMPRRGESVLVDHFRFEVVRADSRRIHLLRMHVLSEEELAEFQSA